MRHLAFPILLLAAATTALACAGRGTPPAEPLPSAESLALREQTADQQVLHAINRLGFGPRSGDVQRVRAMGVDRWIAQQLQPERIADTAADRLVSGYTTLDQSPAELVSAYPPPQLLRRQLRRDGADSARLTREDSLAYREAVRRSNRVVAELGSARVARAVVSERQLQEVMTDFWENHFNVFVGKGAPERYFLTEYDREAIRPHALGKFRDLLGAVAKSDAMLFYLDNWQSVADSGRPVLEARSAGRGARGIGARRGGMVMRRRRRGGMMIPGGAPRGGNAVPTPDGMGPVGAAGAPPRGANANGAPRLPAAPRRRGLNENYGRELLELHTLGVDGGYTQQDVIEVARAFTGWTIRNPRQGGGFVFRPELHDAGAKTVLGHALPAGRGMEDGEAVLDIVARHPATAHFIAYKLARRFVSDTPPGALVDRAAETFRRTDGDIRETVRTIVTSPEFFSRAAYRAKVKTPFEAVVSALRAMGATPDTTPRTAQLVARLGQPLWGHQAPNGWPETGDAWMNTGAILNRINFGLAVAAGRVPGATLAGWPEAARLADAPRAAQVDGVVAALLGGDVSPDTRAILLSGEHPLLGLPNADSLAAAAAGADSLRVAESRQSGARRGEARDDETAAMAAERPERRARGQGRRLQRGGFGAIPELDGLAQIVGLALGAPEFQRR